MASILNEIKKLKTSSAKLHVDIEDLLSKELKDCITGASVTFSLMQSSKSALRLDVNISEFLYLNSVKEAADKGSHKPTIPFCSASIQFKRSIDGVVFHSPSIIGWSSLQAIYGDTSISNDNGNKIGERRNYISSSDFAAAGMLCGLLINSTLYEKHCPIGSKLAELANNIMSIDLLTKEQLKSKEAFVHDAIGDFSKCYRQVLKSDVLALYNSPEGTTLNFMVIQNCGIHFTNSDSDLLVSPEIFSISVRGGGESKSLISIKSKDEKDNPFITEWLSIMNKEIKSDTYKTAGKLSAFGKQPFSVCGIVIDNSTDINAIKLYSITPPNEVMPSQKLSKQAFDVE